MRRIFLTAILLPCYLSLSPAETFKKHSFPMPKIDYLAPIMRACELVESGGNPMALGKDGDRGILQIRPILLLDYNQRTGSHYDTTDLYSVEISRKIFAFYANRIGVKPSNYSQIAREWNCGRRGRNKDAAFRYWEKVKKHL